MRGPRTRATTQTDKHRRPDRDWVQCGHARVPLSKTADKPEADIGGTHLVSRSSDATLQACMPDAPLFSIFIPTYNRASLLERALASVARQTFRDFDVLIVDDGSSDNTVDVVRAWQQRADLAIHYVWQANQGKHVAHNTALQHIRGELTVILDSDDALASDALETLSTHWQRIPEDERKHFAGVEGLCADLNSHSVIGTAYPIAPRADHLDSDYIDMREHLDVAGDKAGVLSTQVLRAHPFPVFAGEPFCPESIVWRRIAHHYRMRYINEIIQLKEYRQDGLTARLRRLRLHSPQGMRLLYLEEWQLIREKRIKGRGLSRRFRALERYLRYSLRTTMGTQMLWKESGRPVLFLPCFLSAYLHNLSDRMKS